MMHSLFTPAHTQRSDYVAAIIDEITTLMSHLGVADSASGTVDWVKWDALTSLQLELNNISDMSAAGFITLGNREHFLVRIAEIEAEFISLGLASMASQDLGISGELDFPTSNVAADAALYDDLAALDGTFGTNRYGWHMVAVAGVTSDLKTILFGTALMENATGPDFDRLLEDEEPSLDTPSKDSGKDDSGDIQASASGQYDEIS
mmetsp:Transcript_66666/g.124632  ORF Transcript_66666/g.124632 Transcript_66666/m.124632 type:complete len:206 (+) Transcript_66666:180-797(+)